MRSPAELNRERTHFRSVFKEEPAYQPSKNNIMKASTSNIARGDGNIALGKTEHVIGKVVRSPKLQAKGALREVGGDIQKAVGKAQKSRGK